MDNFIWQENYSVGVDYFDNQHKTLFRTAQSLYREIMNSKSELVINNILNDLLQYVNSHFHDEEYYMEKYGYKRLLEHKQEHKQFENKIKELQKDYQEGKVFVAMKLLNYLQDWFFDHIVREDQRYGPLLRDKEIRSAPE
ncbi:MAG: bacteriohemerythrin [Fidelibacterota bacterium]